MGGFTLVELLTVILILGILASLSMSGLSQTKERVRRISCLNSLRQQVLGCLMYADDDRKGDFSNTFSDGDNNLNYLFPAYVSDVRTFRCPSTQNFIRRELKSIHPITHQSEVADLVDIASGRKGPGSSYEIFGFMNYNGSSRTLFTFGGDQWTMPGIKKSVNSVQAYEHTSGSFSLKGQIVGPSSIWLILDGDPTNNYPDETDNHGRAGTNVSACDGSVHWIRRSEYRLAYEVSQDENTGP
jgi:prepilin-type N-terminal cleavage/methylation domain-containing protein